MLNLSDHFIVAVAMDFVKPRGMSIASQKGRIIDYWL
jgi:hypothetical protein